MIEHHHKVSRDCTTTSTHIPYTPETPSQGQQRLDHHINTHTLHSWNTITRSAETVPPHLHTYPTLLKHHHKVSRDCTTTSTHIPYTPETPSQGQQRLDHHINTHTLHSWNTITRSAETGPPHQHTYPTLLKHHHKVSRDCTTTSTHIPYTPETPSQGQQRLDHHINTHTLHSWNTITRSAETGPPHQHTYPTLLKHHHKVSRDWTTTSTHIPYTPETPSQGQQRLDHHINTHTLHSWNTITRSAATVPPHQHTYPTLLKHHHKVSRDWTTTSTHIPYTPETPSQGQQRLYHHINTHTLHSWNTITRWAATVPPHQHTYPTLLKHHHKVSRDWTTTSTHIPYTPETPSQGEQRLYHHIHTHTLHSWNTITRWAETVPPHPLTYPTLLKHHHKVSRDSTTTSTHIPYTPETPSQGQQRLDHHIHSHTLHSWNTHSWGPSFLSMLMYW